MIIDELNKKITLLLEENITLEEELNILVIEYNKYNNQNISYELQKKKQKIFKEIYNIKRKILHNKMNIYRSYERIDYIKRRGIDVPEDYKDVRFTNDNYHEINIDDIESQTKVQKSARILRGLFSKDFFSMQSTNDRQSTELNEQAIMYNKYVSSVKKLFDTLVLEIKNYLIEESNKNKTMSNEQLMFSLTKHLEMLEIDLKEYELPDKYNKDIELLKNNYIKLLTTELNVYLKSNLTSEDLSNLSEIEFFGSKVRFVNHLNIFLNQFAEYQIEEFKLETDIIRYDLTPKQQSNSLLKTISYIETFNTEYENNMEVSDVRRL